MDNDITTYFNNRISQELANNVQSTGVFSKLSEVHAASEQKIADLEKMKAQAEAERRAKEASWVFRNSIDVDSVFGQTVNAAAFGYSGLSRNVVGPLAAAVPSIGAILDDARMSEQDKVSYARVKNGTATARDLDYLNTRKGVYTPSGMELGKSADENRTTSRDIMEAFDQSNVAYQRDRNMFTQDVGKDFQSAWDQTGLANLFEKDKQIGSASDVVSGLAKLLLNAGDAIVSNPRATFEYMTENAPQLFVGGLGGKAGAALLAASNAQYGADLYHQGIQNYQAKNGGMMPPPEVRQDMALSAAAAFAAEHLGELGQLKAIGKFGKATSEVASDVAKVAEQATAKTIKDKFIASLKDAATPVGAIAKAGGLGTLEEGVTEGAQTYLEGRATLKPASALDIYQGAVAGAASGGGLSGAGRAANELTGTTPEKIAEFKSKAEQAKIYAEHVKNNNADAYLDETKPEYSPTTALKVLFDHAKGATAADEVKAANQEKARNIVADVEAKLNEKLNLLSLTKQTPEQLDATIAEYKGDIQDYIDAGQADHENVVKIQENIATHEQAKALLGDKVAVGRLEAEVGALTNQSEQAANIKQELDKRVKKNKVSVDAIKADLELASTPIAETDPTSIGGVKAGIERVVETAMTSPNSVATEKLTRLADDMDNGLDNTQRGLFRVMSESRLAENALTSMKDVTDEVLTGNERHKSISSLKARFFNAIDTDHKADAEYAFSLLRKFYDDHSNKAAALKTALKDAQTNNRTRFVVREPGRDGIWRVADVAETISPEQMRRMAGIKVHPKSANLVEAVDNEASALKAAYTEQKAVMAVRYGSGTGNISSTQAPTQVAPTTQTTAAPATTPTATPSVSASAATTEINTQQDSGPLPWETDEEYTQRTGNPAPKAETKTSTETKVDKPADIAEQGKKLLADHAYGLDPKSFADNVTQEEDISIGSWIDAFRDLPRKEQLAAVIAKLPNLKDKITAWFDRGDFQRKTSDALEKFAKDNKEALSKHPDAMKNFVAQVKNMAVSRSKGNKDASVMSIYADLMGQMFQKRGDDQWRQNQIADKKQRLARYEQKHPNKSSEPKFMDVIRKEIDLLEKNDLQGMVDEAQKFLDNNRYIGNIFPAPDLKALESLASTAVESPTPNSPINNQSKKTLEDGTRLNTVDTSSTSTEDTSSLREPTSQTTEDTWTSEDDGSLFDLGGDGTPYVNGTQEQATALANALQAKYPDRKLGLLSEQQQKILQVAIDKLASVFSFELSNVAFLHQEKTEDGKKVADGTMFREATIQPAIAFADTFFSTGVSVKFANQAERVLWGLAHELSHLRDRLNGYHSEHAKGLYPPNYVKVLANGSTEQFKDAGKFYNEVAALVAAEPKSALAAQFRYIIEGIDRNTPDAENIAKQKGVKVLSVPAELYAQFSTLLVVNPDLFHEKLPQAFQAAKANQAQISQTTVEDNGGVHVGSGNTGSNVQGSETTDGSTTSEDTGSGSELTPTITALTQEKSPKGTLYKARNLITDYLKQKVGGNTSAYQRPLVAIKDFFSNKEVGIEQFISANTFNASPNQMKAVSNLAGLIADWTPWFNNDLKLGNREFFYKDPFRFLINTKVDENGQEVLNKQGKPVLTLDENVSTALVYGAVTQVLNMADRGVLAVEKDVKKMLGLGKDDVLPPSVYNDLAGWQYASMTLNTAGKPVVDALGLSASRDAPMNLLPNLELGFATRIEKLLIEKGLLRRRQLTAAEMQVHFDAIAAANGTKPKKAVGRYRLVQLATTKKKTGLEHTQDVLKLINAFKGSNGIIDKLFSVENQISYPSLTPVTYEQETTKTGRAVPKLLTDVNNQNSKQKHYVRKELISLLNKLGPEAVMKMVGIVNHEDPSVSTNHKNSVKATSDGLRREMSRLFGFINDVLEHTENKLNTPFYFSYDTWLHNRVGVANNGVNPQAHKSHRTLITREGWESTIDFTNDRQLSLFKLFAVEAFGVKIDRHNLENSVEKFEAVYNSPEIQKITDALVESWKTENSTLSQETIDAIVNAVEEGGENLASFDGLVAMAQYKQALNNGKKPFKTSLPASVDGVTNGPILGNIVFGAVPPGNENSSRAERLNNLAERGGIYTEKSGVTNFPEWKSRSKSRDLYEHVIGKVYKAIQDYLAKETAEGRGWKTQNIEAVQFFAGAFTEGTGEEVGITKDGRKVIKSPVTEMFYGASTATSLNHMAQDFLISVEKKLTKTLNEGTGKDIAVLTGHLNKMLAIGGVPKEHRFGEVALTEKLSPAYQEAIRIGFKKTMRVSLDKTMEGEFASFGLRRDFYTSRMNHLFHVYDAIYTKLRQDYVNKLVEQEKKEPGTGIALDTSKTPKPIRDLSKREQADFEKRISGFLPVLNTLFSKEEGNLDAALRVGKHQQVETNDAAYTVESEFETSYADTRMAGPNNSEFGSKYTSTKRGMASPGVAMLPLAIQSLDSYISHTTQLGESLLNNHDSVMGSINKMDEITEKINGVTFHALLHYSPLRELHHAYSRSVVALAEFLKTQKELDPDFIVKIGQDLKNLDIEGDVTFEGSLKSTKTFADNADRTKFQAMLEWRFLSQYALVEKAYQVTPEDISAIESLQKSLDNPIKDDVLRAAEYIDHVLDLNTAYDADGNVVAQLFEPENKPQKREADDTPNENFTYTTTELYEGLDEGKVNPVFDKHLRDLLDSIVTNLHGAFGTFKEKLMKDVPIAASDVFANAMATGEAPFASSLAASGFNINNQSMFVAEQIEATVNALLATGNSKNHPVYRELVKVFREAKSRLSPQDFYKGDWATAPQAKKDEAQALYDYVFNSVDDRFLSRFAALGLAHEDFNKLLKVPSKIMKKGDGTIAGFLKATFHNILALFNGFMTNTKPGQDMDKRLESLVRQLVQIESKRTVHANAKDSSIISAIDRGTRSTRRTAKDFASHMLDSKMFKGNSNKIIAAGSHVVGAIADNTLKYWFEGIKSIRNTHFKEANSAFMSAISEMNGNPASLQGLFRVIKSFEKNRKDMIGFTKKSLQQSFVNASKLTTDVKKSITNTLLRTDAHVLLDNYDEKQIAELLENPTKLKAEIAAWTNKLSNLSPDVQHFMKTRSDALAYYMVHNHATIPYLLMNAGNIAKMYGSTNYGTLTGKTLKEVTSVIDTLTTLKALSYLDPNETAQLLPVFKEENARTDGENGIRMVMATHKHLREESQQKLFGGANETLMIKGYVPEIYNPHTDIKAANEEEGKKLELLGYVKAGKLAHDPHDPLMKNTNLYVLRDGGLLPWLSGMFSYTGTHAKGSHMHGDRNRSALNQATHDKVNAKVPANFDPRMVKTQYTIPLLNNAGGATNFQYHMMASTKDSMLQRNNDFDQILGTFASNIYDKENSPELNAKAVELFFKEYEEKYTKYPQNFMRVSPTSPDPELRNIYNMLPQATKDKIFEVWGSHEMVIEKSNLDLAFGYRKKSLSTIYETDYEFRSGMEKAFTDAVDFVLRKYASLNLKMTDEEAEKFAKSAAVRIRRAENAWQAITKEVKDIYVVKNIVTMVNNIKSNAILLMLYGVPVTDAFAYMREAWVGAEDWRKNTEQLALLKAKLASGNKVANRKAIEQEIKVLELELANNPVKELMEAGMMPTIVEDVGEEYDPYSYKSEFIQKTERFTSKINPTVRKVAKELYMAHDTKSYQFLSHVTQLSDFVGRYALYKHLTTRKENPVSKEIAMQEISDAFVNYDVPMHRSLQYLDDMGLFMFTKYFLRIQRVIRGRFVHGAGKMAMMALFEAYVTELPTILDSSIILRAGNNPFGIGALGFPSALDDLATMKLLTGLIR